MMTRGLVVGLCTALAMLGGCAVTTGDGRELRPGQQAFADYVEYVFRLQNDAASELAFALDAVPPSAPRYALLESAETALLTTCDGLNALADARRQGDSPGGLRALRAARQTPECERAAKAAVALLAETPD